jgi:tRNA (guanine37-N1)-methyltransferase
MALRIDILTLFPELLESFRSTSIVGAAVRRGEVDLRLTDIRSFATDAHRVVDDAPYGGGDGMVLKCEPVVAAVEAVRTPAARLIALGPRGRRLDQARVAELARESHLVLVCGRYAGFDERILEVTGAEELSIGDYVLSGGEVAAWVVSESVIRLLPGVLGNPLSPACDSFCGGLLEHPVYTRPPEFRGRRVPRELLSGNHAEIARFRRRASLRLTAQRRPDLLEGAEISTEDREILREVQHEKDRGAADREGQS